MVTPLELGPLAKGLFQLGRRLAQVGVQPQSPVQLSQYFGRHQALQSLIVDHTANEHAVFRSIHVCLLPW